MSSHDSLNSKETTNASREAAKGAIYGAGKYGLACLILAGIGQAISPVYRGLTIQFKVYLQMSGMLVGGFIEGDNRMRDYEVKLRMQRRLQRERLAWQEFERQYPKIDNDE